MKKITFLFILIAQIALSQAKLIKDINLGNSSSNPSKKVVFKEHVYFVANDGIHGNELWRTDGTQEGTTLFKDCIIGENGGFAMSALYATDTFLYFYANDGVTNYLWKTDGTEAGTEKIKMFSSFQNFHTSLNNQLIFTANNQLWKTDGTQDGTTMLKNYPVFGNRFVKAGNQMFFSAEHSSSIGKELYKTDGTVNGTVLIKDIRSGSSDSFPNHFRVINGIVFFSANNGSSGTELWKTDGTEEGTFLVKDVNVGSENTFSYNSEIVVYHNYLYFIYNNALWQSDGTEAGTLEVINGLGYANKLIIVNDKILLIDYNSTTQKQVMWVSDGTETGTTSFLPNYTEFSHNGTFAIVGNTLFFQGTDINGYELWKTDGTEEGTFLVKDIHPLGDDNNIEDIVEFNEKVIFTASDGNYLGKELYISDGTELGTYLLKDINTQGNNDSNPQNFFQFGDKILFSADNGEYGRELWIHENDNATLVKDINLGPYYSNPSNFIEINGTVYFTASTKQNGTELWKTDGTESGTSLVKDLFPNQANGVLAGSLVTLNNKLYFIADNGVTGYELWQSDGTDTGTQLVKDINLGAESSYLSSGGIIVFNNAIYFTAHDGDDDYEVWKSDGTETGTQLFHNYNFTGSSRPNGYTIFNNELYYFSNDDLIKTDGTSATKVSNTGGSNLTISGDNLFFTANYSDGGELWKVLGSYASLVKDIRPGSGGSKGSFPSLLTDHNGVLYFVANDGTNGNELWKSDGTNAGTVLVKNIITGSGSAYITQITSFGDKLVFGAGKSSSSQELWVSDGTENGTEMLQEINPSTEQYNSGSRPHNFFVTANSNLFFTANNGVTGYELWQLEAEVLSIKDRPLDDKNILIYPNPTFGKLTITDFNQPILSVKIYNVLGKEVMSIINPTRSIDVSKLNAGVYVLHINSAVQTSIKKIIKK